MTYIPPERPQYQPPNQQPSQPSNQPPSQPQHPQQYAPPPGYTQAPGYAQHPYAPTPPGGPSVPGPGEPFDGAHHPGELNRPLYGATFAQAFVRFFKNYANFAGRASRSEYWWTVLIYALAFIAMGIVVGIVESASYGHVARDAGEALIGLVFLVFFLGSIVPWLAITWRRLHDANMPGPLYFLVFFPYLGSLAVMILTILGPKPEGRRFDRPQR